MADEPTKGKPLTEDVRKSVVRILMAGLRYPELLEGYDRDFVASIASSYRRFGVKMRLTEKQMDILAKIGNKLCVDLGYGLGK
jgi:hypothetical protein